MDLLRLVPQLFYDLIARVVPGGALIAGTALLAHEGLAYLHLPEAARVAWTMDFSFVDGLLIFALSWLVGHLLSPLSRKLKDRVAKTNAGIVGHPCLDELPEGKMPPACLWRGRRASEQLMVLFDWVRLTDADCGARLTKLRAEHWMFAALAVAFALSAAANLLAGIVSAVGIWFLGSSPWSGLPVVYFVLTVALLAGYLLAVRELKAAYYRFQKSAVTHFILLASR